ncbi:hypothetical protein ACOMHN_022018 [Nucella lapillus]
MASSMAQMAGLLANMQMPTGVDPVIVNLPKPPKLEGRLKPNTVLANCVKFAENVVRGPESIVTSNGYLYTGMRDGNVVEVRPNGTLRKIRRMSMNSCGSTNAGEAACGRPLGIREYRGYLIVADAYHGIIALNPGDGSFQIVVDGRMRVNGKRLGGFINDLAVAKDGSIYFTTSSAKYTRKDHLKVILEGETSGRVLVYNRYFPGREKVRELVTTLNLPNGLQLSKDNDYLLVGEGGRFRIHKVYIDRNSKNYGSIETFADNLPGYVDNIRRSPRGTYWVGLGRARYDGKPALMDLYGNQPSIRGALMKLPENIVMQRAHNYGMVLEFNEKGQIIRSLHDPTGVKYSAVSEVEEEKGILYFGSFDKDYICKLNVSDLPPVYNPDAGSGGLSEQLANFLRQIRSRLEPMGPSQVRDVVIALVQNLVQVKLDAMKAQARADKLQKEVDKLNQLLSTGTTTPTTSTPTTGGGGGTTTAAATATTTTSSSSSGPTISPSGGSQTSTQPSSGTTSSGGSQTTQAPTPGVTTASGATAASDGVQSTSGAPGTTAASGTTNAATGTTAGAVGSTTQASGTTTAAGTGTTAAAGTSTTAGMTAAAGERSTDAGTTAAGGTTAEGTPASTTAQAPMSTSSGETSGP